MFKYQGVGLESQGVVGVPKGVCPSVDTLGARARTTLRCRAVAPYISAWAP